MLIPSTSLPWDATQANTATSLRSAATAELDDAGSATAEGVITDFSSLASTLTTLAPLTYAAPARTAPQAVQTWLSRSEDSVSKLMARNFSASGNANRLNGLGNALLERFASNSADFSQTVVNFVPTNSAKFDAESNAALSGVGGNATAKIALSIRTRSGALVNLVLSNQANGLKVEIRSSGPLTAAERQAVGQLASGLEHTVQSITADKPRMDITGLAGYDSTVLAGIDLKVRVNRQDGPATLEFHADSSQRTLRMQSPMDSFDMAVDLRNSALQAPPAQREQAIASQLQQIDQASARGHANADWIAMVKDAFAAMQRATGAAAESDGVGGIPSADSPLLTGLADFQLRIQSATLASNPMQLAETDSFAYQLGQKTTLSDGPQQSQRIQQVQTSSLKARFHSALNPAVPLKLTSEKSSQNYLYTQIDDTASSTLSIVHAPNMALQASLQTTAHQSTRVQKYLLGVLVDDKTTPKDRSARRDLVRHVRDFQNLAETGLAQRVEKAHLRAIGTQAILLQADLDRW
ncbi:hypothetical protein [Rhodoferax sp.]|uniref:hypothetical protein n=1 Tax=Rhodoferax sp. TaxID=50421 RepID=UPI00374CBB6A